jgi:hypothetical protein
VVRVIKRNRRYRKTRQVRPLTVTAPKDTTGKALDGDSEIPKRLNLRVGEGVARCEGEGGQQKREGDVC